ncbi:hypothetical protein [Novosphingobium sp. M1R2S20]|uniref:Uncharacterized protein n=1 Tax=Novosphingobium rhizovicinum TaxID=3228928 RepID=A0ABV3RFH6_9SPHN
MAEYPHLLSPGRIGPRELKNRLCRTTMGKNLSIHNGAIGEQSVERRRRLPARVATVTPAARQVILREPRRTLLKRPVR